MAEKREWTMISDLVGDIHFSVSGGKEGHDDHVPKTDGFIIRVTYATSAERMKAALNSTRIAVQNVMRTYYKKNKRFPFVPGKVQAVNGDGEFALPVATQVDRLESQVKAGQVELADKIRLAKAIGLEVPQDWLDQAMSTTTKQSEDDSGDDANGMKYPEGSLDKVAIAKLRIIAQNEELEGYDELTADEIREELYLIEK